MKSVWGTIPMLIIETLKCPNHQNCKFIINYLIKKLIIKKECYFFIVGILKAVFSYYLYSLSILFIQCDLLKIENFLLIFDF
jgi:hypothetical protein